MTLSELALLLNTPPAKSWNDLTAQQKLDFRDTIAPKVDGFDDTQRAWFRNWWFVCTQANVDAMNAALPAKVRVKPVNYLGVLYLNIDLATDCMNAGDTYVAARSVLRALICTNVPGLPDLLPKTP